MKCEKCGAEIRDGVKFCENCGSEVINSTKNNPPLQDNPQPIPQPNQQPISQMNPQQNPQMRSNPDVKPNQQTNPHPGVQPNNQPIKNPYTPTTAKPKKPWYKRWWIWLLMGIGTIMLLFNTTCICAMFMPGSTSTPKSTKPDTTVASSSVDSNEKVTEKPTEKATEKPTEKPTEKATVDPKKAETDFKASCSEIDFKTLSRNPDKYKGNNYVLTGQVIQVLDSDSWFDNTTTLRINITKNKYEYIDDVTWTDTIIATVTIPKGADRIIENDVIKFWGTCDGLYTYESIMGQKISVPKIDIMYYQLGE